MRLHHTILLAVLDLHPELRSATTVLAKWAYAVVCRYKPILVPKLSIAARNEFLSAFPCLFVVSAFHIDGVRNMSVLIEEIGPIMLHSYQPPA